MTIERKQGRGLVDTGGLMWGTLRAVLQDHVAGEMLLMLSSKTEV